MCACASLDAYLYVFLSGM